MNDMRPFGLNFLEVDPNMGSESNPSPSTPNPGPKKPKPDKFYTQAVTITSTHDTM